MKYGNCWFYAVSMWAWFGGAIIICWSPRNVCVAHVMRSDDVRSVSVQIRGVCRSLGALFSKGGYLVLGWDSDLSPVARASYSDSVAGVVVSEFIPLKPYRGALGVLKAHFFRGEVRVRRMPGPDDTLTGMR